MTTLTAVETLSAEELASHAAYELGRDLNEVQEALGHCARATRIARDQVMEAKLKVLRATSVADVLEAKCERIIAETTLTHIRDRVSTLRLQTTILQSLLRAANIT